MGTVPFHYVDLRAFCYETEDDQRVENALRTFLPEEYPIERNETKGHHGDRIIVFSARVEKADDIRHVLDTLDDLDDASRRALVDDLDERINDNCSLFFRFDKQAAYEGTVRQGEGITFRAKVEAYPAKKETAVENARSALTEQ